MPKLVPIKPQKLIKILLGLNFVKRDAEGSHVFFTQITRPLRRLSSARNYPSRSLQDLGKPLTLGEILPRTTSGAEHSSTNTIFYPAAAGLN